ncbi:DUF1801 domain-containing protein [Robertkochia flava]|uniref:DUF1801 domain-containing protein n=1 Tax=Robertkochia flava TaxID=3447986 RepID=UPI001CCCC84F|nr:DUF1801 domain-containing protein [Robertkochia marina]
MKYQANTPDDYEAALPADRREVIRNLRKLAADHLPEGFEETMSYGMIGYVVPHELYPPGYHCDPELPLPFLNLASQKNFIAVYHSGIYADKSLHDWFVKEYPGHCRYALDMGKSCVRFKKMDDIPYALLAKLFGKVTPEQWIAVYEKNVKR